MAVKFAGGTDQIYYGNGWSFVTGCLSFRLRTTQTTTNAVPVSVWDTGSRNGFGFVLNNTSGKITALGYGASSPEKVALVSTTNINDGAWHTIAFNWNTANGGSNELWVDGNLEASANASGDWTIQPSNAIPYLGDNNDTFWPSYVGELAEVAAWFDRALSADDMNAIAKAFSPSKVVPSALKFLAPLIRTPNNVFDGTVNVTGCTASDHPRIIAPVFAGGTPLADPVVATARQAMTPGAFINSNGPRQSMGPSGFINEA